MPPELLDGASQHYDLHRKRLMLSALLRRREPHLRPRLSARPDRVPAAARADGRGRGAARRADPAPAPHEPRQLCRRRDHDALRALPRGGRDAPLRHRPALRRVRRQRRAGRAPADHARPHRRARHALLHAAGRRGRQHLQALRRREPSPSRASAAPARAGTCTRAFQTPGRVVTQIVETPDGQRFFTIAPHRRARRSGSTRARTASSPSASAATSNMPRGIAYADGLDLAKPWSPRSAPPARSARASAARSAPPRRPGGRWRSTRTRKTISPFPFLPG